MSMTIQRRALRRAAASAAALATMLTIAFALPTPAQAEAGGEATSPALGRTAADPLPGCDGFNAPGSDWVHDRTFESSTVGHCRRCADAKKDLEASGSFRGYCRETTPGYRADLYRLCLVC